MTTWVPTTTVATATTTGDTLQWSWDTGPAEWETVRGVHSGGRVDPPTPEAIRRLQEQNIARRRAEDQANRRARALLLAHLTDDQRATLDQHGWFEVAGSEGTRYRIRRGIAGNIDRLSAVRGRVESFCIHPVGLPTDDVMLAQKLLLETDEAEFRRVANRIPV